MIWAGQVEPDDDGGGRVPAGGYVRSMPRAGGDVVTLAQGEGQIVGLAVSAGTAKKKA